MECGPSTMTTDSPVRVRDARFGNSNKSSQCRLLPKKKILMWQLSTRVLLSKGAHKALTAWSIWRMIHTGLTAVLRTWREVPPSVTEEERSLPSMPVWRLCSTLRDTILHFSLGHRGGRVGGFLGSWLPGTIRHLLFRYLFLADSTNWSALTITEYTRQPSWFFSSLLQWYPCPEEKNATLVITADLWPVLRKIFNRWLLLDVPLWSESYLDTLFFSSLPNRLLIP